VSTELIRWTDASDRGFFGFAGRYGPAAFKVIPPGPGEDFWMLSNYMCPLGTSRFGATAAEMKQQAETWLREFVSSLGAVFTDDLRGAPPLPGFVPAAALRSELDLLASQHQALGDAKHGQPEALEHLGRAAAFDQVKEILNSLEATR